MNGAHLFLYDFFFKTILIGLLVLTKWIEHIYGHLKTPCTLRILESAVHFAKINVCGKADGNGAVPIVSAAIQQVPHNSTFVRRAKSRPVGQGGRSLQ